MTEPSLTADNAARGLAAAWELLAQTLPGAWAHERGGTVALVSQVPVATLNGVWIIDDDVASPDMDTGLEEVAASGLPHCVQLRPGSGSAAWEVPKRRGLVAEASVPIMAATGPLEVPAVEGLELRRLAPDEAGLHSEIAAEAFGAPVEVFAALVPEALLAHPDLRGYVGEVNGEPVVTAVGVVAGGVVGIFNVATTPAHRHRGYGAVATARAFADGIEAGAAWGWLQSSEIGYRVYQRLGFETLEWWDCWVTPP